MDFNIAQHNPKTSVLFNTAKVRWILQIKVASEMLFGSEKQENYKRNLLGATPCLWRRILHLFHRAPQCPPQMFYIWALGHTDGLGLWGPILLLRTPKCQTKGGKACVGSKTKVTLLARQSYGFPRLHEDVSRTTHFSARLYSSVTDQGSHQLFKINNVLQKAGVVFSVFCILLNTLFFPQCFVGFKL